MKLLPLSSNRENWLKEFDHWVTPSLEEIKDSDVFRKTILSIKEVIELLGAENKCFTINDAASANYIADAVIHGIRGKDSETVYSIVISFSDLLFLVTGKTDNNNKCQFPVYIKEVLKWKRYPSVRNGELTDIEVPRVVKSKNIAQLIVKLEALRELEKAGSLDNLTLIASINSVEKEILFQYFNFILNQEIYSRHLKAFGSKYFELKKTGSEEDILTPIIIGYVRGSASASGGHKTESILRTYMNSWGLRPNEDYNIFDVKAFEESKRNNGKTRAYDFALPYNVKDWDSRIFIQSQFYAGDSGSVSHKNVDQTSTSRKAVKAKVTSPKFVEYVDGAGYYGSLNGDLKRLFNRRDTDNFFQIRTSHIKLRQLLQSIGFLTPLELVHALSVMEFSISDAMSTLKRDGIANWK